MGPGKLAEYLRQMHRGEVFGRAEPDLPLQVIGTQFGNDLIV